MSIPNEVIWSASVGGLVFAIGLARIVVRGELHEARGLDKLILLGPLFYAAPLAAFGTEHFTLTADIASLVPSWMPWHEFWAYFVGACFIAAGVSMVAGILTRLSASLVALTFFVFVVAMDAPAWAQAPADRIGLTLALRELSFCGGALAPHRRSRRAGPPPTSRRSRGSSSRSPCWSSASAVLHGDHVPGVP